MKFKISLILLTLFTVCLYSSTNESTLCKDNENIVYGFVTKNNKVMSICVSSDESYIVYRYGTKNKIEFEYPKEKKDSWLKFKYSYFMRGGGPENEGLDLNYLKFENNGIKYIVYEEYSASDDSKKYGIRIENSKINTDIRGDPKSVVGSLIDFRFKYEELIEEE